MTMDIILRWLKMTRPFFILGLICLPFFVSCGKEKLPKNTLEHVPALQQRSELLSVRFVKEKSLHLEDLIHTRLHLDWEGVNIHMPPGSKKFEIRKYNHQLEYLRTHEFFTGLGPGDFVGEPHFYQCGDFILAPAGAQWRINIFDKQYNFIKYVSLGGPMGAARFSRDGKYVAGFCITNYKSGYNTVELNLYTFPEVEKILKYAVYSHEIYEGRKRRDIVDIYPNLGVFFKQGELYLLNTVDYTITRFDLDGKITKRARVPFTKKEIPEDKRKAWLIDHVGERRTRGPGCNFLDGIPPASTAVPLGKGFLVVRRIDYSTGCRGMAEADYIDYGMTSFVKTSVPCFERIYDLTRYYPLMTHQYKNGYLYLVKSSEAKEDLFLLEKWRVIE